MTTLEKKNNTFQLIVDGKPFIALAGELGNSSASSAGYMEKIWPNIERLCLNTLLVPVYWELVEPREGSLDFGLVDSLCKGARKRGIRFVLLWFGTWKNGMSCYAPEWVKRDSKRFPRARNGRGVPLEILSPFSPENRDADSRAFRAIMRHIREIDSEAGTVIMVQVENETAMIDDSRDRSNEAEAAFMGPVPERLLKYIAERREALHPGLRSLWEGGGARKSGRWKEVFGESLASEEVFMAWHFASFIDYVAASGKEEHAIPMFANAALNRAGLKPGEYPSGGPLPHLLDVWRAGAPSLDFFSPDIYMPDFIEWCKSYDLAWNPLFIPEAANNAGCAARVFYALGAHKALGYSPFAIETMAEPESGRLSNAYSMLSRIIPLICEQRQKGNVYGALLDTENPAESHTLGEYLFRVAHDHTFQWSSYHGESELPASGCIIICISESEYMVAGTGVIIGFEPASGNGAAGIASIDELTFDGGALLQGRRLNGDETHQGRLLRIEYGAYALLRLRLYLYE